MGIADPFRVSQRDYLATLTQTQLRSRYVGAWDACDRSDAHALCVEMRRRGLPVPAWPGIHEMPEALADATPPGMVLLAVLRTAGGPWNREDVRRAVMLTYPDPTTLRDDWKRDIGHAVASGLVIEDGVRGTWALGAGPRVEALLATMPEDGELARHVRVAWEVARR